MLLMVGESMAQSPMNAVVSILVVVCFAVVVLVG